MGSGIEYRPIPHPRHVVRGEKEPSSILQCAGTTNKNYEFRRILKRFSFFRLIKLLGGGGACPSMSLNEELPNYPIKT